MTRSTYPVTRRQTLGAAGAAGAIGLAGCSGMTPAANRTTDRRESRQQGTAVRAYVVSYHWGYVLLDDSGNEVDRLSLSPGEELRLTMVNVEADDAVDALPQRVRCGLPDSAELTRRNEDRVPVPEAVSLEALHEVAEGLYPDHALAIVPEWATSAARAPGGGNDGGGGPGGSGSPGGSGQSPWGGHHGPHGGAGPNGGWGPHHGPGGGHGPGTGGRMGPGTGYGGMMGPGMGAGGMLGYGWSLAPPTYLWHHSTVPAETGFVVETTGTFGFACPVYCGHGHPYMVEEDRIVVEE